MWKGIAIVAILTVAAIYVLPGLELPTFQAAPDVEAPGDVDLCPTDKDTAVSIALRNTQNTTAKDYLAGNYVVWKSSGTTGTGTELVSSNAATANAYESQTLTGRCPVAGKVYVIGESTASNSGVASFSIPTATGDATADVLIPVTRPSQVRFRVLNSLGNNITGGDADSFDQDAYTTSNYTISTTKRCWTVDLTANTAGAATGPLDVPEGDGALLCTNADGAYFGTVELSGAAATEADVPTAVSGTETKCWSIPAVAASENYRRYDFCVTPDADPGNGQDIRLKHYDNQYFEKDDGNIGFGPYNDANTAVGSTDRSITLGVQ